jgi:hypothetical protein
MPFARRFNAINWIVNDILRIAEARMSEPNPASQFQWDQLHRVRIANLEFVPGEYEHNGAYRIEVHPSTLEAMAPYRDGLAGRTTMIHKDDVPILPNYAFSRYEDLARFLTSTQFSDRVQHRSSTPYRDREVRRNRNLSDNTSSVMAVLQELADKFRVGGQIFSGMTLMNDSQLQPKHADMMANLSPEDIYLSFVDLWPDALRVVQMVTALQEILRQHFPSFAAEPFTSGGAIEAIIVRHSSCETSPGTNPSTAPAEFRKPVMEMPETSKEEFEELFPDEEGDFDINLR